jgi:glycerol-3-phosphate dehydrogenase
VTGRTDDVRLWEPGWREHAWQRAQAEWDLIVVGGGITGAGILSLAARCGLSALLLEQGDFASGTSSRSSKLVHGGLRYLKQLQLGLTRESVRERQRLLAAAPGLVLPLPFLYPLYAGERTRPWMVAAALEVYTRLAPGAGRHHRLNPGEVARLPCPPRLEGLRAAFGYGDAATDDARLVLRVIADGLAAGRGRAEALSYCRVERLLRAAGRVAGVAVVDLPSGRSAELRARVVVNATGVWADRLRERPPLLRPLRGSHLFFRRERLPLDRAVAFGHPEDGRPVFAYPWEGVTLVGTTDVDHRDPLDAEPSIAQAEADYLLDGVRALFPQRDLGPADVLSTQAGVRPVVSSGKADPSAESREHVLLREEGLVTVTGGKLTTFRPVAVATLRAARRLAPDLPACRPDTTALDPLNASAAPAALEPRLWARLEGRHGRAALRLVEGLGDHLTPVIGTPYLWAELLWSLEREAVTHLGDLLLRRLRCGILRADGGAGLLPDLEAPCRRALGWDERRWADEVAAFRQELATAHGLPPSWR